MTNYTQVYENALQDGDMPAVTHAKKELLKSLINEIAVQQKATGFKNDPTGTPVTPYVHGAGGLLAAAGALPTIFSAMVQAYPGMATAIPRLDKQIPYPDEFGGIDTPYMVTLTGQTEGDLDDSANQPVEVCDDPPTAGLLKRCLRTVRYGWYSGRTRELAVRDVGRYINSWETPDFTIANNFRTESPFLTDETSMTGGNWINSEWQTRIKEVGNSLQRLMMPQFYSGNPANSSAGSGYREIEGVNQLYTATAYDASTGLRCDAADSLVINWGTDIESTNLQGVSFYEMLEAIEDYLLNLAETTGLAPFQLELSMSRNLFRELTRIVPIQRFNKLITTLTGINGTAFGGTLSIAAREEQDYRETMWNGQFLPLNGRMIPVRLENDSVIGTTRNATTNVSTSAVYFHCVRVLGNTPVLYWQFRNMGNRFAAEVANRTNGQVFFTDNGKFLWTYNQKNGCIHWTFQTEPRLMAHTPFLSARLTGVQFNPVLNVRDFSPTNSSFFYNGGSPSTPIPYEVPDFTSGSSVAITNPGY